MPMSYLGILHHMKLGQHGYGFQVYGECPDDVINSEAQGIRVNEEGQEYAWNHLRGIPSKYRCRWFIQN